MNAICKERCCAIVCLFGALSLVFLLGLIGTAQRVTELENRVHFNETVLESYLTEEIKRLAK